MALKPKTKAFADKLLGDSKISATQAYIDTHQTDNRKAASVASTKLLKKPSVKVYMKKHVTQAALNIVEMANNPAVKSETRLKANQDILDRSDGKAIQKQEIHTTNLNLNIEGSKELADSFTEFMTLQTRQ